MYTKRLILTLAVAAPLASGLVACGSDSVAPAKASPAVDTLNADFSTIGMLFADSTMSGSDTVVQYGLAQYDGDQDIGWTQSTQTDSRFSRTDRGVVRYALPVLAGRGVVDSARFTVWQCTVAGYSLSTGNFDPYVAGHVQVDHVQYPEVVASSAGTFLADTLGASLGPIATDSSFGFKTLAVTAAVAADYAAKRRTSEFRLEWVFDRAPVTDPYEYYYGYLGGECGSAFPTGPSPFLIIWSH